MKPSSAMALFSSMPGAAMPACLSAASALLTASVFLSQAVKAALSKAESEILKDHAACCVSEAIALGDTTEQRVKFNELIDLFEKVKR